MLGMLPPMIIVQVHRKAAIFAQKIALDGTVFTECPRADHLMWTPPVDLTLRIPLS